MQPADRTSEEIVELVHAHFAGEDVSEELGEPEA
jgi:hypothetical protein